MNKEFPAFLTKVASFPNETWVVVLYDHLGLTTDYGHPMHTTLFETKM
jgi:hypothetical protein